jgi:coproporphyrinogen III oxidase-like Fe-S oxidoreductase
VVRRSVHLREPRRYLASAAAGPEWRVVPAEDLPFEFMMNALRLNEGFTAAAYEAGTGQPLASIRTVLDRLTDQGLLASRDGAQWQTTPRGMQFLNELLQDFLPESATSSGS